MSDDFMKEYLGEFDDISEEQVAKMIQSSIGTMRSVLEEAAATTEDNMINSDERAIEIAPLVGLCLDMIGVEPTPYNVQFIELIAVIGDTLYLLGYKRGKREGSAPQSIVAPEE